MSMIRDARERRGAVALHNVRPAGAPVPVRGVDPTLARIVADRPAYTDARIEGRPVRIYLERDRLRWGKLAALVVAIAAPIVGVVFAAVYALNWLAAHWYVVLAVLAVGWGAGRVVRALRSAGVCCPGLHCDGCRH